MPNSLFCSNSATNATIPPTLPYGDKPIPFADLSPQLRKVVEHVHNRQTVPNIYLMLTVYDYNDKQLPLCLPTFYFPDSDMTWCYKRYSNLVVSYNPNNPLHVEIIGNLDELFTQVPLIVFYHHITGKFYL